MTIKAQFETLKENWLIALLIALVVLIPLGSMVSPLSITDTVMRQAGSMPGMAYAEDAAESSWYPGPMPGGNFAPDADERRITKSAHLSTEVERGGFQQAEAQAMSIIDSSDSYLLNQNAYKSGEGWKAYHRGSYTIKVDAEKYDSVLSQLKGIGEVTSFSESADDITGSYEDVGIELQTERARLERYKNLLEETQDAEYRIQLTDRIFDQERRIKYLQDRLDNLDKRVIYSTINLNILEERSGYADIVFITLSDLVRTLVSSVNSLLKFLFFLAPWAVAIYLGRLAWKLTQGKKKKR